MSRITVNFKNIVSTHSGIKINEGIDRYAYRKGLFVIKPSGVVVAIANDDNFKPMTW